MNQFSQILIHIVELAVISTSISGAAAWLMKSIIKHYLNRDIEQYKMRIAHEAAKSIEEFKSQLQIAANEHDVRFTALHAKRVEILSELHSLLDEANISVRLLDSKVQYQKELKLNTGDIENAGDNAIKACKAAFDFFRRHQLYLSKELTETTWEFIRPLSDMSSSFTSGLKLDALELDVYRSIELRSWRDKSDDVRKILMRIEEECRLLLDPALNDRRVLLKNITGGISIGSDDELNRLSPLPIKER